MDVTAWEMAPRDELPALRQRRLDSFLTFLGPAGFATPDDLEALESCQQGFSSGGVEWMPFRLLWLWLRGALPDTIFQTVTGG